MKRHAPEVRQYMTHLPVEAEQCETVGDAAELMSQHKIDHIPVMSGSHLKGVLSRIQILESHVRLGDRFTSTPVEQICSTDALTVSPVDSIDEVASEMLKSGTDCALVVDGGFVVGVFTTTDVLRFVDDFFGQSGEPKHGPQA